MKSILIGFLAVLALCSTANAQCPGGRCGQVVKETVKVVEKTVDTTVNTTAKVVHRVLPPYKKYRYVPYRTKTVVVKRAVVR
jgi:hypothetical protein